MRLNRRVALGMSWEIPGTADAKRGYNYGRLDNSLIRKNRESFGDIGGPKTLYKHEPLARVG